MVRLPQLADLDGDDIPEIVLFNAGTLNVWYGNGRVFPGWPQLLGTIGVDAAVIGDLDGDGQPDIVVLQAVDGDGAKGKVRAFSRFGQELRGFPKFLRSGWGVMPAIADLDGNGRNDLIVVSQQLTGQIEWADKAWVFDLRGVGPYGRVEWGQFGNGPDHQGVYRPRQAPPPPPTATATRTVGPSATPFATPCVSGSGSPAAAYPVPVREAASATLGDQLYTFGGRTNSAPITTAARYDPATATWTTLAPLPAARAGAGAVSDGTYLYILNGIDAAYHAQATLWRYNPQTDTYAILAPPAHATYQQAAVYLAGRIYRIAGRAPDYESLSSVEVYTLATARWTAVAPYPQPVNSLAVVALPDAIYTAGGIDWTAQPIRATYRYDPATNRWDDEAVTELPLARAAAAGAVIQGYWVLAGGYGPGLNATSTVAVLNLAQPGQPWAALAPLPAPRALLAGTELGSTLHLIGGTDGATYPDHLAYAVTPCGCTAGGFRAVAPTDDLVGPVPSSGGRWAGSGYNACTVTPSPTRTAVPSPTATPTAGVPATGTATAGAPGVPPTATATAGVPATGTATAGATGVPPTATATAGAPATGTATAGATGVPPTATPTAGAPATASATPCTIQFSDVTEPTSYYYQGVYYLACHGVISGYSDGTFKPFNNTTRGQMTKIVTLAFNLALVAPPTTATFADVDPSNVFYQLIETAAARGIVSGYTCGGVNPQTGTAEPCDSARRPYFRPSNAVTRGQLTKIVVLGAAWPLITPPGPTFTDVAPSTVFYGFIETAVRHGAVGGYSDGTFHPSAPAFRGQIAKIVYLALPAP